MSNSSGSIESNKEHESRIKSEELVKLYNSGFKPIALSENHIPLDPWTPIFENPNYWNVNDFYKPEVYLKFTNVASALGKTHLRDDEGNELYIQVLDIDSEYIFNVMNTPISQLVSNNNNDKLKDKISHFIKDDLHAIETDLLGLTMLDILKEYTIVTKSRKPFGFHIWWLSHQQNRSILSEDCKKGYEFEIKTDKRKGLCTLPTSTHRDDKSFRYYFVGKAEKLLITDLLYEIFVELLNDCLRTKLSEGLLAKVSDNNNCISIPENAQPKNKHIFYNLSPKAIQISIDYLLPYYMEGDRHNFALAFSGMAFHSGITRESTNTIMEGICAKSNDYKEKNGRILSLNATYKKGHEGSPITGGPALVDLIVRLKGYDVAVANEIVNDLKKLWENDTNEKEKETRNNEKNNTYDNSNKKENDSNKDDDQYKSKSIQEILMEIANENIEILFKDQLNEGFASVLINDHYEIIPLRYSRFKKFLSKIYYENTNKVANAESINNVISILQAKAEFGNLQYVLSLRVAEHDGNIYYDLTNEKHQIIEISKSGNWKLIDKSPVPIFKRYNQTPQDLPSVYENFVEGIDPLDDFISNLTNIKDKETRILIKVAIVSFFVPNIPHTLLIIHGGKGSAKSTFMSLIKYIVDPSKPPLLTIHDDKREFIQQLAHNYVAAYDNLKYNPKWLSDETCKAITGIGQSKRANYTDDEDKIFEYKHCLLFNGINIAFSEPDIIDRSIIIDLPPIKKNKRKTEKEILQKFFELRPKILRYIFDILSKAVVIKNELCIGDLPRMADFAIWCEAISRAMGYKEYDFLDAYYHNIRAYPKIP